MKKTDQVMLLNCTSGMKYRPPKVERKLNPH